MLLGTVRETLLRRSTLDTHFCGGLLFAERGYRGTTTKEAMTAAGLSTAWWTFRSQGLHAVSIE